MCENRETYVPVDVIHDLIEDLRHRFSECSYNLLSNNCNNFSDELAKLLLGKGIPVSPFECADVLEHRWMQDHIVKLPDEVMSTPFGQMIRPMLAGLETQLGSMNETAPQKSASAPPQQPSTSAPPPPPPRVSQVHPPSP